MFRSKNTTALRFEAALLQHLSKASLKHGLEEHNRDAGRGRYYWEMELEWKEKKRTN